MIKQFLILIFLGFSISAFAQSEHKELNGSITFISTENYYVSFVNTNGIQIGDTLYILKNIKYEPVLIVRDFSSTSCICNGIGGNKLNLSTTIFARIKNEISIDVSAKKSNESISVNDIAIKNKNTTETAQLNKAKFDGRLSVSNYSNFSSNVMSITTPNYRMRYNLFLNASYIGNSGLSFENYMSYTHTINNPLEKFQDLKVYNLALKYEFNKTACLTLGRKINVNTANIGAVDGLQFEKSFKTISIGALAGFRPNDTTYGFDSKLLQYGAFVAHNYQKDIKYSRTSVAFFNQMNDFKTDRRYIYIQHSNSLLKNVDFFGSSEIDLYSVENNTPKNTINLTSLYLSLSYRPVNNLSLSMTFDQRSNVYYYETFKSRIDSLLEKEMRQGIRFRFNYRPLKYLSWGGSAGYRLQTPTSQASTNAVSYLSYSNVPLIDASITLTGTALKTANVSGYIVGASMAKDFFDGDLSAEFEYRKDLIFVQDIADVSVFWKINKSFMLSADFEATFDNGDAIGRVFLNLTKRF